MFDIITEIEINAPAERVWAVISDLGSWSEWHPYLAFEGSRPVLGQVVTTVATVGDQVHRLNVEITQYQDGVSFCWTGEVHEPAYAKGVHCFTVESTETGARLRQTELVSGPLSETENAPTMKANAEAGFNAANAAFKKYIEGRT